MGSAAGSLRCAAPLDLTTGKTAETFCVRCWSAGARRLHFSIPAPLNRTSKPLSWLARDLEAEPPAGGRESGSIGGKPFLFSILAHLLAIIHLRRLSPVAARCKCQSLAR
jgi:hypothetical protein